MLMEALKRDLPEGERLQMDDVFGVQRTVCKACSAPGHSSRQCGIQPEVQTQGNVTSASSSTSTSANPTFSSKSGLDDMYASHVEHNPTSCR